MITSFPKHDWNPNSGFCSRCLKSQMEIAESSLGFACMSDEEIEWTKQKVLNYDRQNIVREVDRRRDF